VIFADGKVELDILPKCYFNSIADEIIKVGFLVCSELSNDISIEKISPHLAIKEDALYFVLGKTLGTKVTGASQAKQIVKDERYSRLNNLIDEKFTKSNLINLLTKFENRNDDEIRRAL
jgi:hypothetical protein